MKTMCSPGYHLLYIYVLFNVQITAWPAFSYTSKSIANKFLGVTMLPKPRTYTLKVFFKCQ